MATHSSILGEDKRKRRIKFNLHFLLLPVLLKCDCRTQAFLPQPLFTGPELLFLSVAIDNYTYSGEGNGNPLQYSCLENPMDGGALHSHVISALQPRDQFLISHMISTIQTRDNCMLIYAISA